MKDNIDAPINPMVVRKMQRSKRKRGSQLTLCEEIRESVEGEAMESYEV